VIVVDSSVWVAQFRGRPTRTTEFLAAQVRRNTAIGITDVVYMELLRGARTKAELGRVRLSIGETTILRMQELGDFEFAADLYRTARTKGHTVRRATDCMIAAVCIRESVPLLHDDADFDRLAAVSNLHVV
jgi:predicted nucleic acid-binding protein